MKRRRVNLLCAGLAMGLGLAACDAEALDELLLDAWCTKDSDCASGQECVVTPYQGAAQEGVEETNNGPVGWCRNSNACSVGAQPGCTCDISGDGIISCTNPTGSPIVPSTDDITTCECRYRCSTNDFGEDGCPGNLVASTPESPNSNDCVCQPAP